MTQAQAYPIRDPADHQTVETGFAANLQKPSVYEMDLPYNSSNATANSAVSVSQVVEKVALQKVALDRSIAYALRLIGSRGNWTDALRIAVLCGGVPQADVARTLKVERSTVARWIKGASAPPKYLGRAYANRLAKSVEESSSSYLAEHLIFKATTELLNVTPRGRSLRLANSTKSSVMRLATDEPNEDAIDA